MQRDILPIVEGTNVNTRYGMVRTDHILFIAAGAFHVSKPSDLIPEIQGRFPIRVEMKALTENDFVRILTGAQERPDQAVRRAAGDRGGETPLSRGRDPRNRAHGMHRQRQFRKHRRAPPAHDHGGAARRHPVSREAIWRKKAVRIDADYVRRKLSHIVADKDTSRYIL